jgi:hypothetical protein
VRRCGNCGQRPPIVTVNGVPLCVDCYRVLQAAERDRIEAHAQVADEMARMLNFMGGQIESAVGMPGLVPRYQLRAPAPLVNTGPIMQNITIHDNAIGVLNTGTIEHLDQTVGTLRAGGAEDLADALATFIETAANADALNNEDKRELLDGIDLILQEAAQPEEKQHRGVLKTVLTRVTEMAATVATVAEAWQRLEPLLRHAVPWLF